MKGIPTRYRNVQFRSRLEAKYAAWFEALQVSWLYEPFDLDGYIPDFIIGGTALVEVKPALGHAELDEALDKIVTSGWMDRDHAFAVAVGASPACATSMFRSLITGRLERSRFSHEAWVVPYGLEGLVEYEERALMNAGPEGYQSLWLGPAWADAGNAVQWNPRVLEAH